MSVGLLPMTSSEVARGGFRFGFARASEQRSRLARYDQAVEGLARLHRLRALFADASALVGEGWIQHSWFAYCDDEGRQHLVGAHNLHQIAGKRLTGACLVGAIVHAGGGLAAARSEPVHRALDLTWQALFGVPVEPAGSGRSPGSRVARVRELTRWNDRPDRSAHEVGELLDRAGEAVAAQLEGARLLREPA